MPARISASPSASGATRPSTPRGATRLVRMRMRADDAKAFDLELADDRAEQPVVAEIGHRAHADLQKEARRAPIGTQRGERRPAHAAGQYQLLDAVGAQDFQPLAAGAETDEIMRLAGERRRDRKSRRNPARNRAGPARGRPRSSAAAARRSRRECRAYPPLPLDLGWTRPREESSLMKRSTSSTGRMPANRVVTSTTRSAKVPVSPSNSA